MFSWVSKVLIGLVVSLLCLVGYLYYQVSSLAAANTLAEASIAQYSNSLSEEKKAFKDFRSSVAIDRELASTHDQMQSNTISQLKGRLNAISQLPRSQPKHQAIGDACLDQCRPSELLSLFGVSPSNHCRQVNLN